MTTAEVLPETRNWPLISFDKALNKIEGHL